MEKNVKSGSTPPLKISEKDSSDAAANRALRNKSRFLPITIYRNSNGLHLEIRWKRLFAFAVVLSVMAWLGLASLAYLYVKHRRGFTEVQFTHMLFLPAKWEEYRISRGEFFIAKAKDDIGEQRYREAFHHLRVGVANSPENLEGRMLLAQFYVMWKRTDLAKRLLLEGVEKAADNLDYLKTLFTFLLQQQEDVTVIEIAKQMLALDSTPSDRTKLIALALSTASFHRGNYDVAEDTIRTHQLNQMRDGIILGIRIEWERGRKDAALASLASLAEQAPQDEEIYAIRIGYLRDSGRHSDQRRVSLLRQINFPDSPRPRIDLLYIYDIEEDDRRLKEGIDDLFRDFSDNSDAMLALADFAANTGRPELAYRIYIHAKENNLNWEGPALMTVEAHVVAKQYQAALIATRQMLQENPEWGRRFYSVFNGLQAIANYGLGDAESAQIFLSNFLSQTNVRAENLVAVSNRLLKVGARTQARQVLVQAVTTDPLNQAALAGLIRIDIETGNTDALSEHVQRLLQMRKPPRDLLGQAYQTLGSDKHIFAPGRTALLESLRTAIEQET